MATSRYAQLRYVTLYHITGIATLFIASCVLAVWTFGAGDAGTNPSRSRMSQDELIALA